MMPKGIALASLVGAAALVAAPPVLAGHMPYALATGWDVQVIFTYVPTLMVALPGQDVTWNGFGHTATATNGAFNLYLGGAATWHVPENAPPGAITYYCAFHGYMLGVLVIA